MSSCRLDALAALVFFGMLFTALEARAQVTPQTSFPGIGRTATPQEVTAWDIDVRPDFKGLPEGAGSVAKGQEIWEGKCASCHGVFGESNEVFSPLIGGTTAADIKSGRVATLTRPDYPGRTTLMKLSNLSALWDYINRAMPWTQPKSLSVEEVYAVTAYMLNLGGVLPDDFTLTDKNMGEVQQRLPNRNGKTSAHALWPGKELGAASRPDVAASACMTNCAAEPRVVSILPPAARNAHGNLADQNRAVGPQRGADTTQAEMASAFSSTLPGGQAPSPALSGRSTAVQPAPTKPQEAKPPVDVKLASAAGTAGDGKAAVALTQINTCTACHTATGKLVGPSWADIAKKHAGKADYLVGKIKSGGAGAWGAIPMPPQSLSDADARSIATWLAAGAAP